MMNGNASEKLNFNKKDVLGERGSFGTVCYKGKLNGKLDVAIKQVEKAKTKIAESDFYYSTSGHQNILNFFCVVASAGSKVIYFVTELCAVNLQDLMTNNYMAPAPIDISPSEEILRQILKGVHHLHLLKVVHGNLKPSNILVSCPKGDLGPMIKVADFGLCRQAKEYGGKEQQFLPAYTEGWFCPFDPMDEKGRRTYSFDIFPLALLFGIVASKGVHPHGMNLEEAIRRIQNQQPMTLTLDKVDENLRSALFWDLINKMLSYDATKRPSTADILHHPFFNAQMIISVVQEEEVQHLSVSPSTTVPISSTDEAPAEQTQPDMEEISQPVLVSNVATVPESSKQLNEDRIPDDASNGGPLECQREKRRKVLSPQSRIGLSSSSLEGDVESLMVQPSQFDSLKSAPNYVSADSLILGEESMEMDQSFSHNPPEASDVSPRQMLTRSRSRPTTNASAVNKAKGKFKTSEVNSGSSPSSPPSSRSSSSASFDSQDSEEKTLTLKPNRIFQCQICDKKFQSNYHLSRHARVHTGAKPFICEICGHSSTQIGHLRSHIRIVHEKVKVIECEMCPKRFATNQDLSIHMNKHTGAKPYKCDQCPKEFAAPSNLRSHKKSHSQSK